MRIDRDARIRFDAAVQRLELELESPTKWATGSLLYYRVRDVALIVRELVRTEDESGEVNRAAHRAFRTLSGFANAHVYANLVVPPRRPLAEFYAALRVLNGWVRAAHDSRDNRASNLDSEHT